MQVKAPKNTSGWQWKPLAISSVSLAVPWEYRYSSYVYLGIQIFLMCLSDERVLWPMKYFLCVPWQMCGFRLHMQVFGGWLMWDEERW